MKLLVLSDLHVDVRPFKDTFNKDDSDAIVILPGDIGSMKHFRFETTINNICKHVRYLLFVPGNHEYYNCDIIRDKQVLVNIDDNIPNFILLDNKAITIDGIKFIGSTLWTDMNNSDYFSMHACKQSMNDFWIIRNNGLLFTPKDTVVLHNIGLEFIKFELDDSSTRDDVLTNIVITHHAPSYASVIAKYKGDAINPAFASELSDMIFDRDIKYWIHGHMHSKLDYMIGETRIICNPRGYNDKENPEFDPKLNLSF
jgi:Icc-related predicted phosphoesterase